MATDKMKLMNLLDKSAEQLKTNITTAPPQPEITNKPNPDEKVKPIQK